MWPSWFLKLTMERAIKIEEYERVRLMDEFALVAWCENAQSAIANRVSHLDASWRPAKGLEGCQCK